MKRKAIFAVLIFCFGATTAHAQALKHLQLKIPDRVDQLFNQLKNDSNYKSYFGLQQDAINTGKQYMDSLRKQGHEQLNIFNDSTGQYAPFIAATSQKLQAAVQLKMLLDKQYPVLGQLSYSEQNKLNRLSLDYYQRQKQLP